MEQAVPFVTVLIIATVALPQVSDAVGALKVQPKPHSTVLFAAHVTVGAVVSTTVTVWLQRALLPQSSVASQVRVVVKVLPQASLVTVPTIETITLPQVSLAPGVLKVHAWPHSTVLFCEQTM